MTSRQVPWRTVLTWSGLVIAAAVGVAAVVYVVFWPLSDLIARHDVGPIIGPHRVAALQRHAAALQTARDAARGRLVALGAGLFAAGALIYTGRNFVLSRRTFELTEQSQVTDRYTKAIEQLGSDQGLDVRIGGIYALERIARDSPRDHPTIMEVLAAFIREHSREQWPPAKRGAQTPPHTTRPDVQAAATVIGRRTIRNDSQSMNLAAVNLTSANLTGARLADSDLTRADLSGALLIDADLTRADLSEATLKVADLTRADLSETTLKVADLTRADLIRATLNGADLTSATLNGADLTKAKLIGAKLDGATLSHKKADDPFTKLTGADLTSARLRKADLSGVSPGGAIFDGADLTNAEWPVGKGPPPPGWEKQPGGEKLRRVATGSGGTATH